MARKPEVPYEAPRDGEPSKVCNACGVRWPRRLMRGGTWRCINCARRYERDRVRRPVALRRNAGVSDARLRELLVAQGFGCRGCGCRVAPMGADDVQPGDALVVGPHAYCRRCAELAELMKSDPARYRQVFEGAGSAPMRATGGRGSVSVQDPGLLDAMSDDERLGEDVDRIIEAASRRPHRA